MDQPRNVVERSGDRERPPALPATLLFNPTDPGFLSDPYTRYKRLREQDPIHFSALGVWFVSRYDDVTQLLRDRRFVARAIPYQVRAKNEFIKTRTDGAGRSLDALVANLESWFAFLEPPDHTRLRRLVTNAYYRHAIEQLRPYVRECAMEALAQTRTSHRLRLMGDFACSIPEKAIAKLLGFPLADVDMLKEWIEPVGRIFDPFLSIEELLRLNHCSERLIEYLERLIAERRRHPKTDLISALIAACDDTDRLSERELISIAIFNFAAGEETTANLIGNGVLALVSNPPELSKLRAQPELMTKTVEECLRFDAPVQLTSRTATEDVTIRGKTIRANQQVYLGLGSANRDPEQFAMPDEFQIDRSPNHHLSFSAGHHLCVGAMLARLECQEALSVLLSESRELRVLSDHIEWREHIVLRGMRECEIEILR